MLAVSSDAILEKGGKIVLIYRKNFPRGWALPGGHVDAGETLKEAAIREAKEETGLEIEIVNASSATGEIGVYDDPNRDPRKRMIGAVFAARAKSGSLKASTDAKEARWFSPDEALKLDLCFDHRRIIEDYIRWKTKK
ncbi:MAG: NUDIX hydrolase [Candidatus Aenigmarchaeota archaeon]|nr:NUDIX hydrolase [Candidatus Aenigmarchaeota archaeon]